MRQRRDDSLGGRVSAVSKGDILRPEEPGAMLARLGRGSKPAVRIGSLHPCGCLMLAGNSLLKRCVPPVAIHLDWKFDAAVALMQRDSSVQHSLH